MARPIKNIVGQKFNRLTVIKFVEGKNNHTYWKVKCDCGNIGIARGDKLKAGTKKSCGCLMEEKRLLNLFDERPRKGGYADPRNYM